MVNSLTCFTASTSVTESPSICEHITACLAAEVKLTSAHIGGVTVWVEADQEKTE